MSGECDDCGEHTLECKCKEYGHFCMKMKWISVKNQSPDCEKVLAIYLPTPGAIYNMRHDGWFRNTIYSCRMNHGDFIIESHGPIFPATHWMPLPEPPKE